MKINGYSGPPATSVNRNPSDKSVGKTGDQASAVSADAGNSKVSEDAVSLSSPSLVQKLSAEVENQPVVNAEKVESIKQQIASGSYNPDFIHAADKLIESEYLIK